MPPSRKINKISLYCANCAQFYSKFVLLFSRSLPCTIALFVRTFVRGLYFCIYWFVILSPQASSPSKKFVRFSRFSVCLRLYKCLCVWMWMWLWLYDPKCDRKTKHWTVLAFLQTYSFHINVLCTCYDNIVFKIWRCCFSFALAAQNTSSSERNAREGTTNLNKSYLFD